MFSALEAGPLSVEQIAAALDVQAVKIRPLLYALVVAGLLAVDDDYFANTAESSTYLVRGKPAYLGGLQGLTSSNWARILKTAETIRAGGTQAKYDYHAPPQEELVALFRGLYPGSVADAHRLMDLHDFSQCRSLLDAGGGSGALAITLAQANPQLKATVSDLPSVTAITRQFIAEAQATDQVEILAADAVSGTLSGSFDVVVARHLIQVLSVSDSRRLLRNLSAVTRPGGAIHIIGWILDNSRLAPQNTVGFNLVLLNGYDDGQAYTEEEHCEWLSEAGFTDFERAKFPDGASILTAHKPA